MGLLGPAAARFELTRAGKEVRQRRAYPVFDRQRNARRTTLTAQAALAKAKGRKTEETFCVQSRAAGLLLCWQATDMRQERLQG